MKTKNLCAFFCALSSFVSAGEQTESNISSVSEAFGHIIYESFERLNVQFDIGKVLQGIEDAAAGKESPLTNEDCIDSIYSEQEKRLKILSTKNLQQAETFLASNAKKEGVVCLEEGKVQYRVITSGKGAEVKFHSSFLFRSTVKTLDDVELWGPDLEESLRLDETFKGLKVGMLGMKEGEKRILYVHPDFSLQARDFFYLFPNTLLTFEIEVLKVNS